MFEGYKFFLQLNFKIDLKMTLELFNSNLRNCVDADLGKLCADSCQEKLENCTELCEDPNCSSRCQGEWLDCLSACPCYSGFIILKF